MYLVLLTKDGLVNKLTPELGNYEVIDEARKKKNVKTGTFLLFLWIAAATKWLR